MCVGYFIVYPIGGDTVLTRSFRHLNIVQKTPKEEKGARKQFV